MYAHKASPMFIHDFQCLSFYISFQGAKLHGIEISVWRHTSHPAASTMFPSSSLSVFNTHAVPLSFSSSAHISPFIRSIWNFCLIFFLSDLIYLTLRKKKPCNYFLLIVPDWLPVLLLHIINNQDHFYSRLPC